MLDFIMLPFSKPMVSFSSKSFWLFFLISLSPPRVNNKLTRSLFKSKKFLVSGNADFFLSIHPISIAKTKEKTKMNQKGINQVWLPSYPHYG